MILHLTGLPASSSLRLVAVVHPAGVYESGRARQNSCGVIDLHWQVAVLGIVGSIMRMG